MSVIADLIIKLGVKDTGVDSQMSRAGKSASKLGSGLARVGKTAGIVAGAAGIGGLVYTLKTGYDEWTDSTKVAAQTEAVLKSTGGTAHVTSKHVSDLAGALLRKSGVDDEAIATGENMLLTFTNIRNEVGKGNDVYDQAAAAVLDMDVAMTHGNSTGESLSHTSILLGKALNDPVKGATALRRVGVALTAAQQDQIKAFVASGDTMSAQKVILQELQKEFGGSAEAMGKTLPGQIKILRENFNNLAGDLFAKMIPALTTVVEWVDKNWPKIQATMTAVFDAIGWAVRNVIAPVMAFLIATGRQAVEWFQAHWDQIRTTTEKVFNAVVPKVISSFNTIKAVIQGAVATILFLWDHFGSTILAVIKSTWTAVEGVVTGAMKVIQGIVNVIGGLIHGDWSRVWKGVQQIFSGVWIAIEGIVKGALGNVRAVVSAQINAVESIVRGAVNGAKAAVSAAFNAMASIIAGAVGRARGAANDAFGRIEAVVKGAAGVVRAAAGAIAGALSPIIGTLSAVAGAANNAYGAIQNLLNIASKIGGAVSAIGGLAGKIPFHANGVRNSHGGLAVVGERGPELVNLPRGADVLSNNESRGMLGGGGVTINGDLVVREEADVYAVAAQIGRRLAVAGV